MGLWRYAALLLAGAAVIGVLSCTPNGSGVTRQLVEVTRGDLKVTVSGSGTLEAISSRRLAFKTAGQIDRVYVSEGQRVAKGDRIASLVADSLELAVAQAEVSFAQAQTAVTQADAALKGSELNLNRALDRITVAEVEAAQSDVDSAKAYLQYVISGMAAAPAEQQATWANALVFAQAKLAAAEAKFNAMTTNSDTEEVAVIRRQVDAARESSELAGQSVTLAQQMLDQAKKQVDDATVYAPFDGVVARVNVKEGDVVSPPVVIAEIVDPSSMQLEVQVDEIDVVGVSLGQKTLVEVDALPDLKIEGQVSFINLLPDLQSGVVVYATRIGFITPDGTGLRVGMSAGAEIIIAERTNVLIVPDRAIGRNERGQNVVIVMIGDQPQEKEIAVGISDGIQIEVLSGLQEGETIVVERASQQSPGLF
ncbi:MAG: hypothetical protein A2147_01185 [Chloroflexi bacterium RBG_16_57_8]|nr:MAG: hypothetical protein A2147_01185 [Chloroflexi bacterium RBG_16_57_8]